LRSDPCSSLTFHVDAALCEGPVLKFESAAEAVIHGDLSTLEAALRRDPALVNARSSRVCCFDPPRHAAIDLFHRKHPRFLDEKIKWRPKFIPDSEIRDAALSLDDARLTIARFYDFLDWPRR
jgi:hypothetical protein